MDGGNKMKALKMFFSLLVFFVVAPQAAQSQSGSGSAQVAQMANISTAGAAGAYSSANYAACSSSNYPACIQGIMGALQMMQSLSGASNSGATGAGLHSGDYGNFTFDPVSNGFCFDASAGCTPDGVDNQLAVMETPFKTGQGYDEALEELKIDAANKLKAFEKKGFKVDSSNGTITGPNGETTSFADAASKVPKDFGDKANQKFAGVLKKMNGNSRGPASAGKVVFKDEYYGGSSPKKKIKADNSIDKKKSLLASLTDKDAKKGAIGIAGDNIFGMVNRRYIKKTKSAEFLNVRKANLIELIGK